MEKSVLLDTIRAFGGQPKTITIPRPFVDFTGTLEAGMMLNQLIYWSERDGGRGRIYKSDKDWSDELCLSKYAVRQARERLVEKGVLRTEIHRANGTPTTHYYLLEDALVEKWTCWIRKVEIAKSTNQTLRNEQIPNRDYTETTTEIKTPVPPSHETASTPIKPNIFTLYEQNIGTLTAMMADELRAAEKEYPAEWIRDAFAESVKANVRKWNYTSAILKRWAASGRGDNPQMRKARKETTGEQLDRVFGGLMNGKERPDYTDDANVIDAIPVASAKR